MSWLDDLIDLLDIYTERPLRAWYEKGLVTDDLKLFLHLGIAPERLQALAEPINELIDKHRPRGKKKEYVTVKDLAKCATWGALRNLIQSLLGPPKE